jgi:hypothetical protein
LVALVLGVSARPATSHAQEGKPKLPVKITSGSGRQAFTGKVQSLDLKRKILNLNTVQGEDTEIFAVNKGVRVASADGEKLKLKSLLPGTNVLIYFEQKGTSEPSKRSLCWPPVLPKQRKFHPLPSAVPIIWTISGDNTPGNFARASIPRLVRFQLFGAV